MTYSLRESIQNDIDTSVSDRNKTFCLKSYHVFNITLPNLSVYPEGFRHFYLLNIVDSDSKQDLQENKVINWCRSAKSLYPLKTKGDGNCLLHAVSMAMWGLEDDNLLLRRLLYVSLVQDTSSDKHFQKRWLLNQRRINQERPAGFNAQKNEKEWEREWEDIIKAAIDKQDNEAFLPYDTLESIHLYILSNILRRPIIVLANKNVRSVYGNNVQECNLSGIYLPLEWQERQTFPSPILIGYSMNHFVPLVMKQSSDDGQSVIPLITSDFTPLIVHFLLPNEEPVVQELLKMYLKTKAVPMTTQDSVLEIPVAKLEFQTIQDHHNLVQDHLSECLQIYGFWSKQAEKSGRMPALPVFVNNEVRTVDMERGTITCNPRCLHEGCEMFGAPSFAGYCNNCFMDYTRQYQHMEEFQAAQPHIDLQPTAPPASFTNQPVYEISMMDEQCKNKCGNRASTKTYPYCHECSPKMRQGHPPPGVTQPISLHETLTKENEPIDDQSLFGAGQGTPPVSATRMTPVSGHSFNKLQPGESHKQCSSPNCKENCLTLQANKCAKCFVTTGFTDFSSSFSSQPTPVQSEPSSQTFVLNDLSGARNPPRSIKTEDLRCKTPNCRNLPHFYLNGYCNECSNNLKLKMKTETFSVRTADKTEDKVIQTSITPFTAEGRNFCMTPGCYGLVFESGLCRTCIMAANRISDPLMSEYTSENLMESATPGSTHNPDDVNPIVTSHKDKVKCASPICHNMIYPPNQMCSECTAILSDAHARCRSQEHRRLSPVQHGVCYSPSRQRCRTTNCQFYGDQRTQGYCSKCYEKDKKDKTKPIQQLNRQKGRICLEPGCDKYGDASMNYRCTFHFNVLNSMYATGTSPSSQNTAVTNVLTSTTRTRPAISNLNSTLPGSNFHNTYPGPASRSAPLLPSQVEMFNVPEREPFNDLSRSSSASSLAGIPVEPKYTQAMTKVEREQKSLRTCKTEHCSNYGNSQKEGYCNSCYAAVQIQRMAGNVSRPQYGDHYCC